MEFKGVDEVEMDKLVKALQKNVSKKNFPMTVQLIEKLCRNIINSPEEEKYRWLRLVSFL